MHIAFLIILGVALAALWETKGPAWLLKAIGWTVGSIVGICTLIVIGTIATK